MTADNGSEFHSYALVEEATGALFCFAPPHHSWERGTNENTNGLVRQYLPKRKSMAHVTQADCDAIAAKLNTRPRKRAALGHTVGRQQVGDAAGVFAFQGDLLDQAYLDRWAETLGMTALLADVRARARGGGPAA